jgi:hypothetical protein
MHLDLAHTPTAGGQLHRELGGGGPSEAIVSGGLRVACEPAPKLCADHNAASVDDHVLVVDVALAIRAYRAFRPGTL